MVVILIIAQQMREDVEIFAAQRYGLMAGRQSMADKDLGVHKGGLRETWRLVATGSTPADSSRRMMRVTA
jgi:hypothetical protein